MSRLLIRWDPSHQEWKVIDPDVFAVIGAFSKLYEAERFVCAQGGDGVVDLDATEVEQ